jgi:periplasmic protein TonB
MKVLKNQHERPIWGVYRRDNRAFLISTGLQTLAVVALFTVFSGPVVENTVRQVLTPLVAPTLKPYQPKANHGGGGGGDRSPLPASAGKLPKPAPRQFTPPTAVIRNPDPKLAMDPSILAPPEVELPNVTAENYGVVLAKIGPPSNGTGSGSGIGSGSGGGVGPGNGPGLGAGDGGGVGGGVYQIGGGVTRPELLHSVDAEYTDEARKARVQGTVIIYGEVFPDGKVHNMRVVHSMGLGLDERALEALTLWRFRPGKKDGKPVATALQAEFSFRLL